MRINAKALVFGFLVYVGGVVVAGVSAGLIASLFLVSRRVPGSVIHSILTSSLTLPAINLITNLGFIFLGGFFAAGIAKECHVTHGLIIGMFALILGFALSGKNPVWVEGVLFVLILPVAASGAVVMKSRRAKG